LVRGRELTKLLPGISAADVDFHHEIMISNFKRDTATLSRVETWLLRLHKENQLAGTFPRSSFDRAIGKVWLSASLACMPHVWACSRYARSPLTGLTGHRAVTVAGFGARALKRLMSGKAA
jgi:hypothetical protein